MTHTVYDMHFDTTTCILLTYMVDHFSNDLLLLLWLMKMDHVA